MIFYYLTLLHLLFWIIFFYKKLNTIFNPVTLYSSALFISVISVYFSDLLGLLRGSNISDSFVILNLYNVSVIFFIIPWINFKEKKIFNFVQKKENKLIIIIYILILLFIILSALTYILLGGIPILDMLSGKLNIVDYNGLIKRLPMGMLSIFLLISTLFSLFFSSFIVKRNELKYKFWFLTLLFFITLVSTVWQGKRQGILMLFFFVIARFFQKSDYSKNINISFSKKIYLIIFFCLFILSFMQIGRVRHNDTNIDNTEILSYTMFPVMNFTYTVSNTKFYGNSLMPNAVINDLFPRRVADNKELNQIETTTFEPSSPSGYLNPWYYDFGIFGIVIGTIILSVISLFFYRRRNYTENNMRKNILILWCCGTIGVYNHLITLNYFVIPMISILSLDLLVVKKVRNVNS